MTESSCGDVSTEEHEQSVAFPIKPHSFIYLM